MGDFPRGDCFYRHGLERYSGFHEVIMKGFVKKAGVPFPVILIGSFLIWIAGKGELAKYWAFATVKGGPPAPTGAAARSGGIVAPIPAIPPVGATGGVVPSPPPVGFNDLEKFLMTSREKFGGAP